MSVGNCRACGIEGQGKEPFICDDCLNPDGGMVVCKRCRYRARLAIGEMMFVEERYAVPIPLQGGVVIVLDQCPRCKTARFAPMEVEVLAVRTVEAAN